MVLKGRRLGLDKSEDSGIRDVPDAVNSHTTKSMTRSLNALSVQPRSER